MKGMKAIHNSVLNTTGQTVKYHKKEKGDIRMMWDGMSKFY